MKLYGKGTIKEIERGKKYHITLSCGKNPVTGKYERYTETFKGTKRQAQLHVEQIRREIESGKAVNAGKITLADWVEQYLSNRESMGKCRPATLKRDRSLSRHISRHFGGAKVCEVTPHMIEGFYAALRSGGVGDTTVKQCHRLLKAIMRYAVNNDIIIRNPCDRVEAPRKPKPQRNAMTVGEANRIGTLCTSGTPTANRTAVYLALATGARLGEVLGLTWGHAAMFGERPFLHIVQQFTGAGEIAPLKTDKDDNPVGRVVPIDSPTVAALLAWKAEQCKQLNVLGIEQGNDTPIITNAVGGFVNHHNFEHWFQSFCVENGFGKLVTDEGKQLVTLTIGEDRGAYPEPDYCIMWRDSGGWPCDEDGKRYSRTYPRPKVRTHYQGLRFHELRHTHFTIRLAAGMDIPTAQALGGWSSPSMLLNVYAHPVAQNIWNSAGFMDRLTAFETA